MRHWVFILTIGSVCPLLFAAENPPILLDPHAVIFNITAKDVNQLLETYDSSSKGEEIAGYLKKLGTSLEDVDYEVSIFYPRVEFQKNGKLKLRWYLSWASIHVGVAKKYGVRCENFFVDIHPKGLVSLSAEARFEMKGDKLDVRLDNNLSYALANEFDVTKPAKCSGLSPFNGLIRLLAPEIIRSQMDDLGQRLAAAVIKEARVFRYIRSFSLPVPSPRKIDLVFQPSAVDTRHKAIQMAFSGSLAVTDLSLDTSYSGTESIQYPSPNREHSYLAVSERYLQGLLKGIFAVSESPPIRFKANDAINQILFSESVMRLIPKLRQMDPTSRISFAVSVTSPPTLSLEPTDNGAEVHLAAKSLILTLWNSSMEPNEEIASFRIGPEIAFSPFVTADGNLALSLSHNDWEVETSGSGADDEMLAAILQEVTFGAFWDTTVHPFRIGPVDLGKGDFRIRRFYSDGDYLSVEVESADLAAILPPETFIPRMN